jgi:predicted dehydrogenase
VLAQINAFEWFNPPPEHARGWLLRRAQAGGGPMFDFGCHRIEVLLNLFGPISATRSLLGNTLFAREVEDTCVASFQFAGGPCAVLTVTHAAYEAQDTLDIFGSRGSIHVATLNAGTMSIKTGAGERMETHAPAPNIHQPLIDDFTRAVMESREPTVNGEVGREVAKIEELIYGRLQPA